MLNEDLRQVPAAPLGTATSGRWVALDALRGIASLSVAWFHFYWFSSLRSTLRLPGWADWTLSHGSLGVEIFFVLSGVVISLSIFGDKVSWPYALRFAVRRSIRLDPPYWATLCLACIITTFLGTRPAWPIVLAHVFYLQNLLGFRNIVSQFWTLCYEVQFYLVLILLVAWGQRSREFVGWLLALVPLAASLTLVAMGLPTHGWFLYWWYAFALGAGTTAMLKGKLNVRIWACVTGGILATGGIFGDIHVIAVATTALAIGLAGRAGRLATWSGGPVLQYLGRISYSLYLTHFLGSNFAKVVAVRAHSALSAGLVFAAATIIAIASAEALYRLVENPAHQLSRRVPQLFRTRWSAIRQLSPL